MRFGVSPFSQDQRHSYGYLPGDEEQAAKHTTEHVLVPGQQRHRVHPLQACQGKDHTAMHYRQSFFFFLLLFFPQRETLKSPYSLLLMEKSVCSQCSANLSASLRESEKKKKRTEE